MNSAIPKVVFIVFNCSLGYAKFFVLRNSDEVIKNLEKISKQYEENKINYVSQLGREANFYLSVDEDGTLTESFYSSLTANRSSTECEKRKKSLASTAFLEM